MRYRLVRTIKKSQFMNNNSPIEIFAKFLMFKNDDFRETYSAAARTLTIERAVYLLSQRECLQKVLTSLSTDIFPHISLEEKYRIYQECSYGINKCNTALKELFMDTIKDEGISILSQRYLNNQ